MIIKVGDEYLDFDGDIQVERQVMNVENLDSVGNFSYSFTIPPTSRNKRILGLESIDKANKNIFVKEPSELQTKDGIAIHHGSILVTNSIGIDCSFISGNTNFFNLIEGNVNEVDLSHLDVVLSETVIANSWSATSGMVFPIIDKGELESRKMPFLRFVGSAYEIFFNDFHPFVYVKDILNGILKKAGLKIDGDLLTDGTYNSLITTNNSDEYQLKKFAEQDVYIGKTTTQTLNDSTFTKIIFDDDTNNQFFNNVLNSFDTTTGELTATVVSTFLASVTLDLSDPTKEVQLQIRQNSNPSGLTDYVRGSTIQFLRDGISDPTRNTFQTDPGDTWHIWGKVQASTPGTVNVTSGTFKVTTYKTGYIFAQSCLPSISSRDFIKDIFRMFDVICSYDTFTKTIHTRIFENIAKQEEQDISDYLIEYSSEPGIDVVSEYTKTNYLLYQEDDSDEITKYNKKNTIPYGGGNLAIDNDFLEKEGELFKLNFTAPFTDLYPVFGLQLLKLKFVEWTDALPPTGFGSEFDNVSDSSGLANFTGGSYSWILKGNYYKGPSKGTIQPIINGVYYYGVTDTSTEVIVIKNVPSSNQILALHLPSVTLPKPIDFDVTGAYTDIYRVNVSKSSSTIPSYSGDWQLDSATATARSSASIAVFAKFPDGTYLDIITQSLSFGSDLGGQGLIDTYYRKTSDILNDPSKIIAEFIMPENVYRDIDFLRPIRISTPEFSSLFYLNKDIGYVDSSTPFQMELIKIN